MSYHFPLTLLALCVLFLTSAIARAATIDVEVKSGTEKVALLELYTSEGCSSCPPADRFVRNLGRTGWYPHQVIPLSFHVTYWNYLGWEDPYSQAVFDRRQRQIAARQQTRTVYTPQLVLDGQDVRRQGRFGHNVSILNAQAPAAHMRLRAYSDSLPELRLDLAVAWERPESRRHAAVYVALFENLLTSRVDAGENSGETLQHDYVVRRLFGPLTPGVDGKDSAYRQVLRIPPAVNIANAGIAAFIEDSRDGSILQAVATSLAPAADERD